MLRNGHQLHGVVARLGDARQHLIAKLNVSADLLLLLSHANVSLIYEKILRRSTLPLFVPPLISLVGIPELGGIVLRRLILHHTRCVGRYAVVPAIASVNVEFIQ